MTIRLDGKVVLVTGAASGIGAATARMIAARGGVAVATDLEGADHRLDVTSAQDWGRMLDWTVATHGRIDGLVSNAGVIEPMSIVDLDLDSFRRHARVHVEGAFIGLQKTVERFRAQGTPAQGSIVVTASVFASRAAAGLSSYCTAKAALQNMARAIGVELGRKGDFIRVNAVAPGPVRTPLLASIVGPTAMDDPANWAEMPLREPSEPDDVAEAIVYLLSDEASFVTASTATVDGGWSLTR